MAAMSYDTDKETLTCIRIAALADGCGEPAPEDRVEGPETKEMWRDIRSHPHYAECRERMDRGETNIQGKVRPWSGEIGKP